MAVHRSSMQTKRSDIRRLWSKSVTALDTAERDEALTKARKETELRVARERELGQSRLAVEMLRSELSQLKRQYDRQRELKLKYKATIKRMRLSNPVMDDIAKRVFYEYKPAHTIHLTTKRDGYQHISFRNSEEMVVCSRHLESGPHGIFKISMRDYSTTMYMPIAVHSLPIKDVQCYNAGKGLSMHDNKSLVLTTSLDKTLKLTSVASHSVVATYSMQAAGWSCCWSSTDPYMMYAAVKSAESSIMVYDIRSTRGHIAKYSQPDLLGPSPIHSLCHIGSLGGQKGRSGLLCGNMEGVILLDLEQLGRLNEAGSSTASAFSSLAMIDGPSSQTLEGSSQPLSQELLDRSDQSRGPPNLYRLKDSSCWSVSYDRDSEQWLGSFRFRTSQRSTEHVLGTIVPNNITAQTPQEAGSLWRLVPRTSFEGGQPLRGFGRSCITTRRDGSIHAVAGSYNEIVVYTETQEPTLTRNSSNFVPQSTNRVVLGLGGASGQTTTQPRQQGSSKPGSAVDTDSGLFIKDVKSVSVGQAEFLCSLSDKEVRLFRWTAQSPMHVDDDDEDSEAEDCNAVGESSSKEAKTMPDGQPQRGRVTEEDGGQGRSSQSGSRAVVEELPPQQHEVVNVDEDGASDASETSENESMSQGSDAEGSENEENEEDEEVFVFDPDNDGYDDIGDYDIDTWMDVVWDDMARNASYHFRR
ncbi:RING finger and WD repeat domain-containing protein 3 [Actinomortierella ambigua]|uniref:RING-type E3 ubiquitin transferase n=1 Tax=Actinomortierella ambigua TaxID=1343610 RepID=A0A9P6QLZ5_9FUNG|nr:RING finger and WD repeat domain-containing protein 3 [Actinomortierella ambigua]